MFGVMLSASLGVLLAYVLWRVRLVPLTSRPIAWRWRLEVGLLLWSLFVLVRLTLHHSEAAWAQVIEAAAVGLLVTAFLVATCVLAADLLTVFGWLAPVSAPWWRSLALLVGLGLSVAAAVQGLRDPVVERYTVRLKGLPPELEGAVVLAMADTHATEQGRAEWLAARAAQVVAERPDLVLLLGDIVEGPAPPDGRVAAALRGLRAPLGVYFVPGNHEHFGGDAARLQRLLQGAGVQLLRDRAVQVAPGLVLAGVRDTSRHQLEDAQGDPLGAALAGRPPGVTILMSHAPLRVERAAKMGVGLMLSGHTHGGQVWPFGYLVQALYGYLEGRYRVGDLRLIVSRGAGTWGARMRLWQRGEILRVTLRAPRPERG